MRKGTGFLIILLMAVVLLPGFAGGATYSVTTTSDANCADLDCDLQSALVAAEAVGDDTLNIAPGLYNGTIFEYNTSNTGALIINGAGPGLTSIQGDGTNRALYLVGIGDLTVKNVGISNGMAASGNGGGLYASSTGGSAWVENCHIEQNEASIGGGAYINAAFAATITNSVYSGNTADSDGGGLYATSQTVHVESNDFEGNTIAGIGGHAYGGGFRAATIGTLTVKSNTFTLNEANTTLGPDGRGGGFYTAGSAFDPLTLADNTFDGNIAHGDGALGGGAYAFRADGPVEISGNRFLNNVSAGDAGGLYAATFGSFGNLVVRNNAFVGNSAQVEGGAAVIGAELGLFHVVNNTATENTALVDPAGIRFDIQSSANILNNIFWGNTLSGATPSDAFLNDPYSFNVTADLKYSDVGAWSNAATVTVFELGLKSVDPLLASDGYHIDDSSSPVIDAGDDTAPSLPSVDIDGDARILGPHVDMGADEYVSVPQPVLQVTDSQFPDDDHIIDFGSVSVGASTTHTVTVQNAGEGTLEIDPIAQPASLFSVINDECASNSSLGAGETCTFDVQFAPDAAVDYDGSVDITSNDGTVSVILAGAGVAAGVQDIAITDGVSTITELDFGRVLVNNFAYANVTVNNEGTVPLSISAVSLDAIDPFSIEDENCTTTSPLAPDGTCVIAVLFNPKENNSDYTNELRVSSDDPDENPATLTLMGHTNHPPSAAEIVGISGNVTNPSAFKFIAWNHSTDPDKDKINYDVSFCDSSKTCFEAVNTEPITEPGFYEPSGGLLRIASALLAFMAVGLVVAGRRLRKGVLTVPLGIVVIGVIASLVLLPGCPTSGDNDTPAHVYDYYFSYTLPHKGTFYVTVRAWDIIDGERYDHTDTEPLVVIWE